jgi:hypothetical protein
LTIFKVAMALASATEYICVNMSRKATPKRHCN